MEEDSKVVKLNVAAKPEDKVVPLDHFDLKDKQNILDNLDELKEHIMNPDVRVEAMVYTLAYKDKSSNELRTRQYVQPGVGLYFYTLVGVVSALLEDVKQMFTMHTDAEPEPPKEGT